MDIARVQAIVAGKNKQQQQEKRKQGLDALLGVGREPRPNCGWLAVFLCVSKGRGREGRFCH